MKRLFGMICALIALPVAADTLGDVKAAVHRLSAKAPVRATFSVEQFVKSAGRFANDKTERSVSAEVAYEPAGVSITIPQALLDKVSKARNGDHAVAQNLIGALRPISIVNALDFRDSLLAMLENATVTHEARTPFHGRPARRLLLKLKPRSEKEAGTIRLGSVKAEDELVLWIGDDDLPLAAERIQKTTAGFMFLKGSYVGRATYTFAHTLDRLIVARLETNDSGAGMGQNVEKTAVETLTLH